jgi:hypothetical protein
MPATRISQGLSGPLSQFGLGLLGFGAPSLVTGFVIGQSSGTFLLFSRVDPRSPGVLAAISWRGKEGGRAARRAVSAARDLGVCSMWQGAE